MAIRFKLPNDRPDLVSFAYSPLLEAVLSLHVFVEPKHHPLQHPWVRRMQRLPPGLKRLIGDFAFAYRCLIPDFLYPSPASGYGTFAEELAAMRNLDPLLLAFEFARPVWDHEGIRDPAKLESADMRESVPRRAAAIGADPSLAVLVFDDPEELARRFARLLEWYWEEAFQAEWDRLEPRLADTVSGAGREIALTGLYPLLGTLAPRLRVEPGQERFGIDVPHDHEVEIAAEGELVLVPSAYVWPHIHVNATVPGRSRSFTRRPSWRRALDGRSHPTSS